MLNSAENDSLSSPVPVSIITGFLGSGKTTLLNRILKDEKAGRIAVIQNEFGEISIDHELVLTEEEGIFEMQNGCLCCTIRDDLLQVLETLKSRRSDFDRILIETTGLADPVPVAQTFFSSIHIQKDFRLDGIITLADTLNFETQLREAPEVRQQLICADLIILNKIDQADDALVHKAEELIRQLNQDASLIHTNHADVPIESLFGISLLHADSLNDIEDTINHHSETGEIRNHEHSHNPSLNHKEDRHDQTVSSFSLDIEGSMDLERLDAWLNMLQMLHGGLLYRMKGILNLPEEDRTFVFQAVFSVLQGSFGRYWKPGETRRNRFVFIGRNLNRQLLEEGFRACLVQPESA